MRVLIGAADSSAGRASVAGDLDDAGIREHYRPPHLPWWRINMISTVDGAATGPDGRSGSVNDAADKRVFDALRSMADAVVVGAGTARTERYGPAAVPIVLVSRSGEVPESLAEAEPGRVLMATCASADGLATSRALLGEKHVIVCGADTVDLALLRSALLDRGFQHVLSEGGPHLFADLVAAGVLDEVCLTVVPRLVGGSHPRITTGAGLEAGLTLTGLLEQAGTLLGRWSVPRT